MSCFASTLVRDGTTSSSDIGRLLSNSIDVHVVTGTGHIVKIYKLTQGDLLEESMEIPLTSVIEELKVIQVPSKSHDDIVVLTAEGAIFQVSIGSGTCSTDKIFTFEQGVVPERKKFGVVREAGIVMVASSLSYITMIDLSARSTRQLYTGLSYLKELVPLSYQHFVGLESETKDSCVIKVFSINPCQEVPEEPMETSSMDLELRDIGDAPGYTNSGEISQVFEQKFNTLFANVLQVKEPFNGMVMFNDAEMACIPLPIGMSASEMENCRESIRHLQHPFKDISTVHLNANGSIMVGTTSGSIHILTLVPEAQTSMAVSSINVKYVRNGSVLSTLSTIRNLVFAGSETGNSCWLGIEEKDDGTISSTRKHVFESFGPVKDIIVMPGLDDRMKIIALCGKQQDSTIRVLRNCVMLKSIKSVPVKKLETLHSLKIGSKKDCWVLASTKNSTDLYNVTDEIVLKNNQDLFSKTKTLVAADMGPYVVQITPTFAHIMRILNGPMTEGGVPLGHFSQDIQMDFSKSITVLDTIGQRIIVAVGDCIEAYKVVSTPDLTDVRLELENSRRFAFKVACMAIHTTSSGLDPQSTSPSTSTPTVHLVVGFANSFNLLIMNLDTLITVKEIPLPQYLSCPKAVIAVGSDLVLSGTSGLYHYENFQPQASPTEHTLQRIPGCSTQHQLFHVKSETPGIFAFEKSKRGVTLEQWASKATYPGVHEASLVAGFCGYSFENHVVVYEGSTLSISSIYRRAETIRLGDNATKMANNATVTFGVITHRIDHKDESKNKHSLSRSLDRNYKTYCARRSDRNTQWDILYGTKDDKEVCSILFFLVDTMSPLCSVEFSPYETARHIVSGQIDGTRTHYYVVATCLSYPQKSAEAKSSIYVLKVSGKSVKVVDQLAMQVLGEPTSLHISNQCIYSSFGNQEYRFRLVNEKLQYELVGVLGQQTIPGTSMQAVRSSTSEDIRRGDYTCPSSQLATGVAQVMKATAPIAHNRVIAIGSGRHISSLIYNVQGPRQAGLYFLPSRPTAIKRINHLCNDKVTKMFAADQVVFGTETGAIGFVLFLESQWENLLIRVSAALDRSHVFSVRYHNYSCLLQERQSHNAGFLDGDRLQLLFKMSQAEIMAILQSVIIKQEDKVCGVTDKESLLVKLQLFLESLSVFYTGLTHE
ncbi:hypothetical protein CAEBREN_10779 [Caenorhabditis brenneri]|uniref:RSE1/DDB1/CPSF1 second beta-propeller domain-containing protein n=1 Tax=Caenorhabditis brenneri TaxID=135651 RepID=G0NI45_CAEBE|nr:hypothetical protein CAEBREN_10779 [Caenorhabditis brenneri]